MMDDGKPWFDECSKCGCDTFEVKHTPLTKYAVDIKWRCSECGVYSGGIINDPFDEIQSLSNTPNPKRPEDSE